MSQITLLQLPVEIFHCFFDYLDTGTILNSIRPVCKQLHATVRTYNKLRLDLSLFYESDLRFFAQFIQPKNVITLTLINNDAVGLSRTNLFLSLFQLDQFTGLKSLTLIEINNTAVNHFFQYMITHPLLSLSITPCRQTTREIQRIMTLLASTIVQSALQNLYLNIPDVELITGDIFQPIHRVLRHLIINICKYEEYHLILYHCAHLRTFVMERCEWEHIHTMQVPSFARTNYSQLNSLTLNTSSPEIDELHFLLALTPSLVCLKIISQTIKNSRKIDGHVWEQFIQTKLLLLQKFEFAFMYNSRATLTKPSLESLITKFRTPFWLTDKHWLVTCDYNLSSYDIIVYTIPVYLNDFQVIIRCDPSSTNNCYILSRSWSEYIYTEQVLTTLELSGTDLEGAGAWYLANALKTNKILTTLKLQQNGIKMHEIRHIADALEHNTILTTLHLENNNIISHGAQYLINSLKNNKTLTTVNLAHNRIGSSEAKYFENMLRENTTLIHLNIEKNRIGDQGVQSIANALSENTTLKTLSLEQNGISSQGARYLAEGLKNNTRLTTLDLRSNSIGDEGAQYLAGALQHNKTLNILIVAYNRIEITGIQHLTNALRNNMSLTTPDLGGNNIDSSGAKYLADAIRNNTTLTTLILTLNQIRPIGAKYLADALETNTVLTTIDLRANKIGAEGTKHLTDVLLKINKTLTALYFRGNNIGLTGSKYFADMLRENTTLITLSLENNEIADNGFEQLANALQENTALKTLNLAQNNITISEERYIAGLLQNNKTLTTLILTRNEITTRGAEYIKAALRNNMIITTFDIQGNNSIDQSILDEILDRNKKFQEENMEHL